MAHILASVNGRFLVIFDQLFVLLEPQVTLARMKGERGEGGLPGISVVYE